MSKGKMTIAQAGGDEETVDSSCSAVRSRRREETIDISEVERGRLNGAAAVQSVKTVEDDTQTPRLLTRVQGEKVAVEYGIG